MNCIRRSSESDGRWLLLRSGWSVLWSASCGCCLEDGAFFRLRLGSAAGQQDGEHGEEPEWVREVVDLGVGETTYESEEKYGSCQRFEVRCRSATDLAKEGPINTDS